MDPVQEQVDAFNSRDLERFIATYSEDVVLETQDGTVMMQGHAGLRAFFDPLFAHSPQLHAEIVNRIRAGAYVVDDEHTTGFVADGFPNEMRYAVIYRVDGGTIAHVRFLGL